MVTTQDKHSSKFLSLVLRHKPSEIGITLDEYGYAVVTDLLAGLGKRGHKLTHEDLQRIVREDGKQRYAFNADESKIKANQGHSLAVDLELTAVEPPKELYHGTATRFLASIQLEGIQKQNRQYVHLSADLATATTVGKRHGELVLVVVDSEQMHKDGYQFYLSDNNVWLTDSVPTKYINVVTN